MGSLEDQVDQAGVKACQHSGLASSDTASRRLLDCCGIRFESGWASRALSSSVCGVLLEPHLVYVLPQAVQLLGVDVVTVLLV